MVGEGENAEAEKSPVSISLHLDICPSLLSFLCWLGSVCALTCSKTRPKTFYGGAREVRRGGAMKPVRVGF